MSQVMLTWLADALRAEGCRVIEEAGWKTRGRPSGDFDPDAVMLHHDASPAGETSNGVDVIRDGRPGLEGPLAQLWLAYDGTWHVVAAGRANHGGEGGPWGVVAADQANRDAIGIETDHTTDEAWTGGQRSEGLRGVAAICRRLGITSRADIDRAVLAHKEYAPGRKVDPDPLDMGTARANLADYLAGGLLGMGDIDIYTRRDDQTFTGDGTWQVVRITDAGDMSLLVGPADAYVATAGLTIDQPGGADGITTGDVCHVRFQSVIDYDGDKPTEVDTGYPITEVPITAGDSFASLAWTNSLGGEKNGGRLKLRLFIKPPEGRRLTITHVAARVLH